MITRYITRSLSVSVATVSGMTDDLPPFQPLNARLAGRAREEVLLTGVPDHLVGALRDWLTGMIWGRHGSDHELCREVALRLRLSAAFSGSYAEALTETSGMSLLEVVDAVIYCRHRDGLDTGGDELAMILEQAGSAYSVNPFGYGLVQRVDATVEQAVGQAVRSAPDTARDLLQRAWQHAYGISPDPSAAYREAVRAVETVLVPLVSPANSRASLGTVVADLTNQQAKWELVLVDTHDQPGGIEHLVGLLRQLWFGQRSRHGGGANSRDQTQPEAEAAVHLAALAMHWVSTGAVRRKP